MDPKKRAQLIDALSNLIFFVDEAIYFITAVGIKPAMIGLSNKPIVLWTNIVIYAENNRLLDELVDAVLEKYPNNPYLLAFKEQITQDYTLGPKIETLDWKNIEHKSLEKIIGERTTLLPISFLAEGVEKARSVGRIVISRGRTDELGTCFLLENNYILTNNHVLRDKETSKIAKVEFNYELAAGGSPLQVVPFNLAPDKGFETNQEGDWTAVKIDGDANKDFQFLKIARGISVLKNDFVNIIQHPGGRHKQIGLYHNVVTYSDQRIIQYLTDTEPGSSGSPVFNSQWEVVGLHHSGGMLKEPSMKERLMRNEGINIEFVIDGLTKAKILSQPENEPKP